MSQLRLVRFFSLSHMTLYWPFLFAFAGVALLVMLNVVSKRHPAWARQTVGIVLLALLIADGVTFGSPYNPVIPAADNLLPTQLTLWLAGHLGTSRLSADGPILLPNLPMLFGLRDLRGYEDLVSRDFSRTFGFVSTTGGAPSVRLRHLRFKPGERHRLDMAAVRYFLVIQSRATTVQAPGFVARAQFGSVTVYENTAAMGRAYGVYQAVDLPTEAAVQAQLDSPGFDPHTTVLLESTAAAGTSAAARPVSDTPPQVSFTADEAEHVVLQARFAHAGYLVLADTWAEGWQASVDGAPVPILRANGIFRAVALAAGRHTVAFDYRPPLVYAGAGVSLVTLLLILMLVVIDVRMARQTATA